MKKIKSLGHELHLANPVKNEGVYEIADYFLESDIFDFTRIVNYCRNNEIVAIMSDECDIATDGIARMNKEIGANCISQEMAELFTNKNRMRDFCDEKNICPITHKLLQI